MSRFVDVVKNASNTTTIIGDELFPIIQNGLTKKITIAELQAGPFAAAISPNIIHSVMGAPDSALGKDGDYAIDIYYKFFYGPKTNGLWPVGFSLQGNAGQGVAVGGTTGQVLAKIDSTDYNTEWVDPSGGGSCPDFILQIMGVI